MADSNENITADYPRTRWFGVDIGGTLTKLVYFEPKVGTHDEEADQSDLYRNIQRYLIGNTDYGTNSHRDTHIQMDDVELIKGIKGSLHFIRFPTSNLHEYFTLAKNKGMSNLNKTINGTGGGAYKFENSFIKEVNLKINKLDELDSVIRGLIFMKTNNQNECYYWENPLQPDKCIKKIQQFKTSNTFPFILVNAGSGVSILAVRRPNDFKRVSGTSLGGGTFVGLTCLLTGCKTFEEAVQLASEGDHTCVDKLVKDIYGGDYSQFNLPGDLVASSFGQMVSEDKREKTSKEDLAKAVLVFITNNIAYLARMSAMNEKIDKVIFAGNFFRANPIATKLLAHTMTHWSNGTLTALFLEHEGYLGAIGCLLDKE